METGNIAVFSLPVFPSAVTVGTAVAKTTTCLSLANKTKQTNKKILASLQVLVYASISQW